MFNRFLVAAPVALALLGVAASPAFAAPAGNCSTTPGQLRSAAAKSTDTSAQRKAMALVTLAEKLCADNAMFEADKKFAAAAKALNVDLAALPSVTASAQ